jgi:hypothetical protein
MATMLLEPGINHIWRNVFYRCGPVATGNYAALDLVENGVFAEQDPGFVDAAKGDYQLKPGAALSRRSGSGQSRSTRSASTGTLTAPVGRW